MPQYAVYGTIAAYLLLGVLLLSLNIVSLWRWWVKGGAIVLTCIVAIVAYFTITEMIGWPAFTALPAKFNLVASRVVEPNRETGENGHIYLWVEELNENNVPVGAPRAFEVPYTGKQADDTTNAQEKINSGQSVMGMSGGKQQPSEGGSEKKGDQQGNSDMGNNQGGQTGQGAVPAGETAAADTIGQGAEVTFEDLPAASLPDKGAILLPDFSQQNGQAPAAAPAPAAPPAQ